MVGARFVRLGLTFSGGGCYANQQVIAQAIHAVLDGTSFFFLFLVV